MCYFAKKYDAGREEYWAVVGLLHDIDFEMYPHEHWIKGEELLRENKVDESIIHAAMSHGYGIVPTLHKPTHIMEKILFACDELTGLIGACALMRPSKSVIDMELASVKKKFKDKKFAAGCNRDIITQGAEWLGWSLDDLIMKTLDAMKSFEIK
jgi:predicted hydrolase (HD superfamily)